MLPQWFDQSCEAIEALTVVPKPLRINVLIKLGLSEPQYQAIPFCTNSSSTSTKILPKGLLLKTSVVRVVDGAATGEGECLALEVTGMVSNRLNVNKRQL